MFKIRYRRYVTRMECEVEFEVDVDADTEDGARSQVMSGRLNCKATKMVEVLGETEQVTSVRIEKVLRVS